MLERRNLATPDEVETSARGRTEVVTVGGLTFARLILEPGWRWSADVGAAVGADSCQATHRRYVVSGRMHIRMDDGHELDLEPGDAHVIGPGHDGWVVGDEPLVLIELMPAHADAGAESG